MTAFRVKRGGMPRAVLQSRARRPIVVFAFVIHCRICVWKLRDRSNQTPSQRIAFSG